ncbi:hypothetical protein ACQKGD_15230 [Peribacillus frigoritolerans]|uniref:hypothetical protein n=1 Tax=Peribacillus frigoritolerans TaxID=450367 RepID=UPI003D01311C
MDSQCDNCKLTFVVTLQEKNHGKGVIESFFTCTHCQTKFFVFIADDYIRQQQNKLKKIYKKKWTIENTYKYNHRVDELKLIIEMRMHQLREKVSGIAPLP